jgi:hypothetical protein
VNFMSQAAQPVGISYELTMKMITRLYFFSCVISHPKYFVGLKDLDAFVHSMILVELPGPVPAMGSFAPISGTM